MDFRFQNFLPFAPVFPYPYTVPYIDNKLFSYSLVPQFPVLPTQTKKKYERTWNKELVQKVFNLTIQYSSSFNKKIEDLTISDFGIISIGLDKTPEQIMNKIREINTNGTFRPGKWSLAEDELLVSLINRFANKWSKIASILNTEIHGRANIRNSKNCKERWNNYLNPNINRGHWTALEDVLLLEGYLKFGNKWTSITKTIPNRIESSVKNRIKSLINKIQQCHCEDDLSKEIYKEIEKRKIEIASAQNFEEVDKEYEVAGGTGSQIFKE